MAAFTFTKADVAAICAQYPHAFGGDPATLDARRRLLMPILCRAARAKDGPVWFLINRLDRNDADPKPGRLTSDVLWHVPSNNHIDVLSAKGAMWEEHGPVTDTDWIAEHPDNWPSWEDVGDTPPRDPPTPPSPPPAPPRFRFHTYDALINGVDGEPSYADQVDVAYVLRHGHLPATTDQWHNAYRLMVEGWSIEDVLADIRR